MKEILESMTRPYELRGEDGSRRSEAVGMIDLTIKATRSEKLISLPLDKEYRAEVTSRKKRPDAGDEFLATKAGDALARLRAINE